MTLVVEDILCENPVISRAIFSKEQSVIGVLLQDGASLEEIHKETFWARIPEGMLFLIVRKADKIVISLENQNKSVRALECLDYMVGELGTVTGDAIAATATIPYAIMRVKLQEQEIGDTLEYGMVRFDSYLYQCQEIHTRDYAVSCQREIASWTIYRKRKMPWAFVKTTSIAPVGTDCVVKMLENTTGAIVTVSEDTYIMIGCRGEIYNINKEAFQMSYVESDEPYDLFSGMTDFIPAIEIADTGECVPIDEIAHLCYPSANSSIRGTRLLSYTRVYPPNCGRDYFVGKAGDYVVQRMDNPEDMYIIRGDILLDTYEEQK